MSSVPDLTGSEAVPKPEIQPYTKGKSTFYVRVPREKRFELDSVDVLKRKSPPYPIQTERLEQSRASIISQNEQTSSSLVLHKKLEMESRSAANTMNQPPFAIGEYVVVKTRKGFQFGNIKFIGQTEFAPGVWVGIALERPAGEFLLRFGCYPIISILGKHDGTVEGVRYFKCEDKHGLFVRQNKITKANLSSFGSPLHQRWSYSHEGVTGMPKVSSYS